MSDGDATKLARLLLGDEAKGPRLRLIGPNERLQPKRIRLRARCLIDGAIHERGEIVILPAGVRGPHRAERRTADQIDYGDDPPIDANRQLGEIVDVPLYDELPDES